MKIIVIIIMITIARSCLCCRYPVDNNWGAYCNLCSDIFSEFIRPYVRIAGQHINKNYHLDKIHITVSYCKITLLSVSNAYIYGAFEDKLLDVCGMDNPTDDTLAPMIYKNIKIEFYHSNSYPSYYGEDFTMYFNLSLIRESLYTLSLYKIVHHTSGDISQLPDDITDDLFELCPLFALKYLFVE